jgi:putative ABC transport system substrate-binding protein
MRRRDFITLVGGTAVTWPLVAARAQQPAMPVVGFVNNGTPDRNDYLRVAFRQGLGETGYTEGKNVSKEYRWAADHDDRLTALVADLMGRHVNVIAATSTQAALAAKAANATIPIVFETGADPIKIGLVASLNRPDGNITSVTQLSSELVAKRLGLLHDLIPKASIVGQLVNPADPMTETQTKDMEEAANALGLQIRVLKATTEAEINAAFATLSQLQLDALLVGAGNFYISRREQLAELAARHSLPTIYQHREIAEAGGLIIYGTSIVDSYRQAGNYTGRILKGEKPADLPVLRPTKFELVINLKTAKTLGLTIPPGVFAIADEVVE